MSKTRMGKRVASLLLSLVMMLSLLPTTVYATGDTGETKGTIVGEANTSDDNTVGGTTGNPELTGEDEGGGATNVSEGETAAVATIGSATYESLDAAIEAVADGETIVVNAGEYTLNGSLNYTGKAFTIAAADGADVSFDMSAAVALHGAKITFNNVIFDYKTNGNYIGLQHADTLVYNNCTINGMVFLYAVNETFNGCTFNQTSADAYNVWTYGAQNVAFNGCTFNCVGKAVLVYNEGAVDKTDLTVTDTKFVASAPVTGKAAIEIDTSLMAGGATITVDDKTTAAGFDNGSNSGSTLWNDKKQTADTNKNTTVTVAGEKVFEPKATVVKPVSVNGTSYETLEDAIDAATPDANGVVTYEISGKVDVTATGWVQVAKSGLTGLTAVKFVGTTDDAKICINGGLAILADQNYDIDVSFEALALSKLNPTYGGDYGHSTNYFTTWLRNSGAAENTVTYTNCTFPNGVSNNQYGKTVFDNCKFTNGATGLYNLWNYGGSTEIKNSSFTGTRGIKAYSEGVDGGQIEVADTTFNGLGEKAAIVVSKATTVTLNKVDATECTKGLLQKDIDGGSLKTTIEANGTGISGKFDITATTTADAAKNEFNISAGTFTSEVSNDYCADGFEVKANDNGTYGVVEVATADGDGTEANPYTLEQLGAMTRQAYIDAQNRLNGTMYVTVGNYAYDTNGVLGNGVRDDTTGQTPDHSKLNAYGENGYLGEKNDGANGKSVVFVGGSITSGVTGYTSIDKIGTSLLLALPAYTNVTFKGTTFNNVMSFNYQLYTSPWSQLGELKFDNCTFNGIIVGAIAAQTLTFNGCEFKNYTNTTDANSSNPTWIRPAYGNWTQGDNEGQGSDFRSLTTINFTDNKVTSTRPVKFEYISQWDITSTVTATGNSFDISKQDGDTAIKNVGLYLGAHTDANAFNLVAENNTKSENTAALYTIPEGKTSLPLGSTVKNLAGEPVELTDALKWKAGDATADKIVLKSVPLDTSIDLDTFIKAVVDAGYTYDGKGVTVKWSPVSGCYDTRAGHTCTAGGVIATGNTPKRVNNGLTQFQLFEGENVNVTVKNVKFEYVPAAFTVCENSDWKGSFTAEQAPAGQLYFMTSGDVNFEGCTFDKVVLTSFNTTGTTTVKDCQFANVYNNYAIKDIRGANISVTGTTITNCGGGIMVSSTDKVEKVTIWKNTFTNVDVAGTAAEGKVGTRALIQIASSGDYSGTSFNLTANTATGCGPVLRQLNQTVVDSGKIDTVKSDVDSLVKSGTTGLGTTDSLLEQPVPAGYVEDEQGNVTISNEAGLFWFAKQVNAGNNFASKTVTLANDIALTKAWTPIGIYTDSKTHFKGTFDGQNHTVSGVEVLKYSANGVGFFAKTFTATIKNLTVEGKITAYGCNYVGGIVGHGYATISNCTFKGNVGSTNTMQVGGIAGSGGFTITNCSVYGNVTAECWAGGIVGNCQDGGAYTNCYVEGVISAERSYWGGGAAGITPVPLYPSQVISSCYSNTVVKVAGKEVNCPIIATYNNPLDYNGYTGDLKIYDNSWNKQKNSNNSYPIYAEKDGVGGVLVEGKDVSRDNNLVMLEDDLQYVTDLSKVRIMAGSAVTQAQVDALAAASIGTAKYITLAAAIAAANNGETVTLLKDVTENVEIAKEKNLTLDLNGKTLSGGTGTAKAALSNLGTITIQDTSAAKTGTIKRDDTGTVGETSYYVIRNQGTMTIESGIVINNSGYKKANPTGSMVGSSLICNGDCNEGGTLTIKGGTFTQNNFIAIKNGALGVLHVSGGTITSNHSAIQNWFKADITGGEIKGQLWTDAYKADESVGQTTIGGDAKFTGEIVMDIAGSVAPTLAINGGNLNVTNWRITSAAASVGAKPSVSGGTFSSAVPAEYCAEGFIPVKNADGTYGVKAGAYVAQIGDVKYETLQAAIDAVKANETIYVLGNIDLGTDELSTYDVKTTVKNVTIDLGGYTVTSAGRFTVYLKVNGWTIQNGTIQNTNASTTYGTLYVGGSSNSTTLKNLTVESKTNGVQFAIASSKNGIKASITVEDGTKISGNYGVYMKGQPKPWRDTRDGQEILNVNGGEITGTTAAIAVFGAGKGNTKAGVIVNINGGKVYSDSYAIAGNGSSVLENTTINISGGKVFSNKDTAIYHPQAGTVTISGGEVYGVTGGVQMCAGTLNVTGGTISATGNGDVSGKTGDGSIPDGAAVSIVNRAYPAGAPTMTISGGTFTSAAGVGAVQAYGWKNNSQQTWDKPNASVSGGTFSSAVKEEYCATGYIPTANADGTYGVKEGVYVAKVDNVKYETLQAAINAAKRNATVTMLANTRENVTISTPYLTLDLNGFTLNGGTEKGKPALTVTARVTVKDSSTAQTGTIMREDTAENSGVSSHYVIDVQGGGWLTFESGTVKNNSGNANGKGASLVRVGDDRVAKYPGLNIKGGTFTQDNFIVIKVDRGDLFLNGGTLNSKNSYAIEDWHRATIKGGTVNGTVAAWTYSGGYSSSLEISGGTINGDVTSVNYGNADGKKATVAITGGTINGELDTRSYDPKTNKLTSISDATKATIEVTAGTFAKDPTKYLVEGSTVKTNSDGTFGVEKAYLATVGKTSYYTMEEAFKAQTASGEPVVMLRDYTTGSPFNSGTINRTVDLNGYTWTCTGTDTNSAAFEINNPDVTLTVKNGKIVSSQLVGLIPSAMGGTIKYDNAGLVFEDVVMTTTAHSGIETNGNNTNDTVTLKNSTLNVPNGYGIYFPSSGTLTIDNSTINAKTMGVQVCAGSLSINAGSAITVTGDAVPKTENDGAIQDGAAISIVNRTGYKGLGDVTVTGGKFTAKAGNKAIKAYDWANNTETEFTANKTVAVSGGTFSSAVPEGLCAPGFIPTTNGDGTYGVKAGVYVAEVNGVAYATLSEAIAAAKDGDTVKLLRDINTPEISYMISRSLTIDLNGMTVTGSGYDAVFQIDNADAKVVIKNGKVVAVEQSGSAGKYTMAIWASKAGCEVTLEGLDVSQKITHTDDPQMDMIYASGGTITINSGNFVSGTPAWTLNCNDTSYKNGTAKIIVTGGTFVGFDPANNKAEGEGTSFVAAGYVSRMDEDGSYTVVPANAKITVGKRLSIGNDLTITYLVNLTDCTNPWVKFQFYNDDIKGYTTVEVKNYGTATVEGPDGRPVEVFTFDFTGVNPQRMTDTLKATVYAEDASGNVVEYQVADYSVAQYCSNKLAKLGQDDSLRKLIGNLVAYGAAAQVYQNYRTDNLVSTVVSGAVSTDYTDRLSSVTQYTEKVLGTAGVNIKGKTLVLSNTFAVRVYFTVNEGVDIANVSFNVTANGKTDTVNSFEKDEKLGYYYFDYANLNATQLDSEVKFESFVNETGVGDMVTYSVNTYLAKKMPNYDKSSNAYKLMAELFNYGCACTEYASK